MKMKRNTHGPPGRRLFALAIAFAIAPPVATWAQVTLPPDPPPGPLESLKTVPVPEPANLGDFVFDRGAAIALGKALFWDMQVGSDGVQACASCHYHAGADHRTKNQVNPGLAGGDTSFQVAGPNVTLTPAHFPLHKLAVPDDRFSPLLRDSNDVISSQGVFKGELVGVVRGKARELGTAVADPVFHVGAANTRRVAGRNAPTVINAVFNLNNFWDGRANFIF